VAKATSHWLSRVPWHSGEDFTLCAPAFMLCVFWDCEIHPRELKLMNLSSFLKCLHLALLLILLGPLSATSLLRAQEQSFPQPPVTGVLGNKDEGALAEITAYLQALSVTGWHDLEGSGTLTFPAGEPYSAELYLSGARNSRLDIAMSSGTRSFRVNKSSGTFHDEKGNQGSLFPETFSKGIVAFPRVWTEAVSSSRISLHDQGVFTGTGQSLHRITMEYPFEHANNGFDPTVATDLYFDPTTHLLVISVDELRLQESPNRLFLRVTRYSNYQQLGGLSFPTAIQQTLDGQLQWNLQISRLTVNTNPQETTFSF
jgi:hypothetical protein